jgi:hypothetical protein
MFARLNSRAGADIAHGEPFALARDTIGVHDFVALRDESPRVRSRSRPIRWRGFRFRLASCRCFKSSGAKMLIRSMTVKLSPREPTTSLKAHELGRSCLV